MVNQNGISPVDVTCGRGTGISNLRGNLAFRSIVDDFRERYVNAPRKDKSTIAKMIVDKIHERGGRFIARNEDNTSWEEVSMQRAVEKACQALREHVKNPARMKISNSIEAESKIELPVAVKRSKRIESRKATARVVHEYESDDDDNQGENEQVDEQETVKDTKDNWKEGTKPAIVSPSNSVGLTRMVVPSTVAAKRSVNSKKNVASSDGLKRRQRTLPLRRNAKTFDHLKKLADAAVVVSTMPNSPDGLSCNVSVSSSLALSHSEDASATVEGAQAMNLSVLPKEWSESFESLKRFHSLFGHAAVPPDWEGQPDLADWCSRQRQLCREITSGYRNADDVDKAKIVMLNVLDFPFDYREWHWYHCFQQVSSTLDGRTLNEGQFVLSKELRAWVKEQQQSYLDGALRTKQIQKLRDVGALELERGPIRGNEPYILV